MSEIVSVMSKSSAFKLCAMGMIQCLHLTALQKYVEEKCELQNSARKLVKYCMQTQMGNHALRIFFTHSSLGLRHVCPFFRVAMISTFLQCAPAGNICTFCIIFELIGFPAYVWTHWQRSCWTGGPTAMASVMDSSVMQIRKTKVDVHFFIVKFPTECLMQMISKAADVSDRKSVV